MGENHGTQIISEERICQTGGKSGTKGHENLRENPGRIPVFPNRNGSAGVVDIRPVIHVKNSERVNLGEPDEEKAKYKKAINGYNGG